jgi:hypothetical protein
MGGALLGAALASIPGVAWADGCRRLGRECRRDSQCCSRRCIGRGDDKVCGCPTGQTLCKKPRVEGRCVNLKTNERHCGSCFNRCEDGQECVEGMCSGGEPICDPPCPDGCTCSTDIAGAGPTCIDVDIVPVSSCTECPPAGFPEHTLCDEEAGGPVCARPCPPPCLPNGDTCMANDQCCSGTCQSGTCCTLSGCTTDNDCCGDNICDAGDCISPGPKSISCTCADGTRIDECREISCELALEEVCVPACETHGGEPGLSCGAGGSC